MDRIATALADGGVTAVAVDMRGHGASGTRGDVAYPGQLDDDLADLVAELRQSQSRPPSSRLHRPFLGRRVRAAASRRSPLGDAFERFVLLAPYLGYTRADQPAGGRAGLVGLARPAAHHRDLRCLERIGIDWPQSLPAIAFANVPEAKMRVTSQYSFRLLHELHRPARLEGRLPACRKAASRSIAGADDELMDAEAYRRVLPPLGVRE